MDVIARVDQEWLSASVTSEPGGSSPVSAENMEALLAAAATQSELKL
jgi:hypothetical protein